MVAPVTRKSGRKMDVHLLQMAKFIGFTEEDAELIRATGPTVVAHADEVTKVVYDHLLEQPGTYNFFRKEDGTIDEERVENRRKGLARWLARTADAKLDYSFAWHMVAMGIAHSHRMQKPMGRVPGPFMVGTMSYTQTAVSSILLEDLEDKEYAARAAIAWNKILMLELDLLLTGYYSVTPPPDSSLESKPVMTQMEQLAYLIKGQNRIGTQVAKIIDRPALSGHVGEYIASEIFDIRLSESAVKKGIDGHFEQGTLAGRSVNIKFYMKNEALLDITRNSLPDYYLVLAGPRAGATSSRGKTRPWTINSVFLFDAARLVRQLEGKVKIGVATSVRRHFWDAAEIYPSAKNAALTLTLEQRRLLDLFRDDA